jgi:hypothetical protein
MNFSRYGYHPAACNVVNTFLAAADPPGRNKRAKFSLKTVTYLIFSANMLY